MDERPGGLVVDVGDTTIVVAMSGGASWTLPIGVHSLLDGPLHDAPDGRPDPEQLTNALGAVTDHFEDVVIESPMVAAAPTVTFRGPHATMLGRVEIGADELDDDYVLRRADADEVFRTLVGETRDERRHNPGLDPAHADSVVATCCAVLAFLRRLDLHEAAIRPSAPGAT